MSDQAPVHAALVAAKQATQQAANAPSELATHLTADATPIGAADGQSEPSAFYAANATTHSQPIENA